MLKKSLLSLAVSASLVGLTGCNISSTTDNDQVDTSGADIGSPEYIAENAGKVSTTYAIFNPGRATAVGLREAPVVSDLLYNGDPDGDGCLDTDSDGTCEKATSDGTIPLALGDAAITDDGYNPIFNAAADLDGFSTTAQIDIPFSAALDESSLVTTGSNRNVVLIPLDYTDPLTGTLSAQLFKASGPAAIEASVITYASNGNDAVSGQGNVLRISPAVPLEPATRYLIVVTNGIKDAAGSPVTGSSSYKALTSDIEFLIGDSQSTQDSLALSATLKQFQDLAAGYGAAQQYSYSKDDIVYSFSFTTGGTTAVLSSMTAPAKVVDGIIPGAGEAFNVKLPTNYRFLLEKTLQDNAGVNDGSDITAAVTAVYSQLLADQAGAEPGATIATGVLSALGADAGAQQTALGGLATIHKSIPSPAPRVSEFDGTDTAATAIDYDTVIGSAVTSGTAKIANGSIKLPYYGGIADLNTNPLTAGLVMNHWVADDELDTKLGTVLAGAGITDASVVEPPSSNVTRLFPLAKPTGYVDAPVSIVYSTLCAGSYKPVVFVHGITSNRTASFGVAGQLLAADSCYATVAMDLPLHGPTAEDDAGFMALTGEADTDQRHFGVTIDAATLQPTLMAANAADSDQSGSMYINLLSFQATRDNVRQSVLDILNLNASLEFMEFTDSGNGDFDLSNVHVVGHSLGAILATSAVAVNNSVGSAAYAGGCTTCNMTLPNVTTVTLANGGGQLTKLLENSNIGTNLVIPGLAALGEQAGLDLGQGSSLYELTLNIFQATVDSGDPINFADTLEATNTPVLAFEIAGDGGSNAPDATVPVDAVDNRIAPALPAPLAGTEPLASVLGLTAADEDVVDDDTPKQLLVRFNNGEHSSFAGADAASGNGVFSEMMGQLVSFLNSNGEALDVTNDSVVVSAQ